MFYGVPTPGNTKAAERFAANRFRVTRQLRYSLDKQIRDTIKPFAQVGANVGHAEHSGDLRSFLAGGKASVALNRALEANPDYPASEEEETTEDKINRIRRASAESGLVLGVQAE